MSWESLYSDYESICKAYTATKILCYEASPCYTIPKMLEPGKSRVWADHGAYRVFGSAPKSSPMMIPVTLASPKEAMNAYLEVLHKYKGLTQVPAPYAGTLAKMGYKVSKRPWGNIDFVMETDLLLTLPGGRFKTRRNELSRLAKEGYTTRPLTSSDVGLVKAMESDWGSSHKGPVYRTGYATELTRHIDTAPAPMRLQGLVLLSPTGVVAGVALGCQITLDTWSCSFRFTDNRVLGAALFLFQAMCRLFPDLPYEADGSGGAPGETLFDYKKRLIQRTDLLVEMFTVKK